MNKQSKALRLADILESWKGAVSNEAAAELRRLHQSEREAWRYSNELEQEHKRLHEVNAELVEALNEAADEIDHWGSYASDYFRIKHDLAGSVRKVYAVIDRATGKQQPKDAPIWYFMRDNHTFRKLTGTVDSMMAAVAEEIADGYTSGSVFCRDLGISIHCDYKNIAAFTEECRAVIAKATGEQQ